jgi:hypothetical protein
MTISVLNEAILLRNKPPEFLREYLSKINLTIFDDVYEAMSTLEAHQAVLFILCGYSEESPLLILRQDTKEEKIGICDFLNIPDFRRPDLMNLKTPVVRRATTDYLQQFSGPLFRSLMFLKIQYNDLELDVTNRAAAVKKTETKDEVSTTTETFDYKEHGKAITEMIRLGREVDKLEKQLRDQVKRMDGIEELRDYMASAKKSGKLSGGRRGNIESCVTN